MSCEIHKILLVLIIGVLSVSKSDDGVVTVPSLDIPSDGKGLIPGGNGTSDDKSIVVPPGNGTTVPGALGFIYKYTLGPVVKVLMIFLGPVFSLLKSITSPVFSIVNYLLNTLGLPNVSPLLNEILIGVQGYLSRVLGQLSGLVGALLGSQDNTQKLSRSKRGIASTIMSPVTVPLSYGWSFITMPWRIVSGATRTVTTPLSWLYTALSYPVSGAWKIGSWPTRRILRLFGFGGSKNTTGDRGQPARLEVDPIDDFMGTLSGTAQDALADALIKGFQVVKRDILPAVDRTFQEYQKSEVIPDSIKGYMKNFHQAYSLLHTLRIL